MDNNINIMEEDTLSGKYLVFNLGKESYGIKIKYVIEIIRIQPITFIPEVPLYVKGVINLRGMILPVIDLRMKFQKDTKSYNNKTSIIIVEMRDITVGIVVDYAHEVLNIPDKDISLPPEYKLGFKNWYIENIGKIDNRIIILLDLDKVLTEEEYDDILEVNESQNV